MRLLIGILTGIVVLGIPIPNFQPAAQGQSGKNTLSVRPAHDKPDPQDASIFKQKLPIAQAEHTFSAQALAVAKSFIGTPYVTGTIENEGEEKLVLNLRELDCWTFMETSIALALTARTSRPTLDSLSFFIQQMRYWGGTIDGYASRMHYFSGWLLQAEKLGYLRDITRDLGGIPYQNKIGYMSARPQKYPALKNPNTLKQIQRVEARLNRHQWFYIPQDQIAKIEDKIQEGDLIALTSWKKDLDIAHQGFAIRQNGRIYLLHASSLGKRVLISRQPLAQYVRSQKGQTGIMVARLR